MKIVYYYSSTKPTSGPFEETEEEEINESEEQVGIVYVPTPIRPTNKQNQNKIPQKIQIEPKVQDEKDDEQKNIINPRPVTPVFIPRQLPVNNQNKFLYPSNLMQHETSITSTQQYPNFQLQYDFLNERKISLETRFKSPKTVSKQRKMSVLNENPKVQSNGIDLAQKKKYTGDKARTRLPKRCGDLKCIFGQHYSTVEEANEKQNSFNTLKGKNTYCPCGSTVQYYIDGQWMRSGSLSKHLQAKRLLQ